MRAIWTLTLSVLLISPVVVRADAPTTQPMTGSATTMPAADAAAEIKEGKAVIDEAVKLVQAKNIDALFARMVPPKDLAKMKEGGEYDAAKAAFAKEKSDEFLAALQECQAEDPSVVNDKKTKFATKSGPPMNLVKIDGKWYIE